MTVYNAGNIYLEDLNGGTSDQIHIYAQTDNIADGAVTDAKLAQSGGVLSVVESLTDSVGMVAPIDLAASLVFENGHAITVSNGVYNITASFSATPGYLDLSGVSRIEYMRLHTTAATAGSGMAFYDENRQFISGVNNLPGQAEYTAVPYSVDVPEGAKYARFTYFPTTDERFNSIPFYVRDVNQVNSTLISEVYELASTVDILVDNLTTASDYDLDDARLIQFIIGVTSGKWSTNVDYRSLLVAIPEHSVSVEIQANSSNRTVFALLRSYENVVQNATPDYAAGSTRTVIDPGESLKVTIPDDATYLFVQNTVSVDYAPDRVTFTTVGVDNDEPTIPLGLHTMPSSDGVLNVIRRCRQMTDVKWTPVVDIPRISMLSVEYSGDGEDGSDRHFQDVFKAGTEYTGVPYSRAGTGNWGYSRKFVGMFVDFETFVTSVRNAKSAMCTLSSYNAANNTAGFFGCVCSGLACYAYGLSTYYPTASMTSIPGLVYIDSLINDGVRMDAKRIRLGDAILWAGYHVGIVTDIVTDDDGEVTVIELSEATTAGNANWSVQGGQVGGLCRRKGWPIDEFFEWFKAYSVYRYSPIDGVTYTPSPFVNVGDEPDMIRYEDMPLIPFCGNGFKYKSGYIPNSTLVLGISGFSYLRVTKDGEPWNVDGTNAMYAVSSDTVDVGFSDIGEYTAYLCNVSDGQETIRTRACTWSVVA